MARWPSLRTLVVTACTVATTYYLILPRWSAQLTDYLDSTSLRITTTGPHTATTTYDADFDFRTPRKFKRRIVAVADLHGDLSHATRVLRMAGIIDLRGKWIAKQSTLVQTGDIVDRGRDTIALYKMMDRLREEAYVAGGSVVTLMGNHEYMNALGDWRYVTAEDVATFGSERSRRIAMSSQGWIGNAWLQNYTTTARVSYGLDFPHLPSISTTWTNSQFNQTSDSIDERDTTELYPESSTGEDEDLFIGAAASFVHGGITPFYAQLGINEINRLGQSLLNRTLSSSMAPLHLPKGTPFEEQQFYSEQGPLWYRGFAMEEDEEKLCQMVDQVTSLLKVRRLIMGHTPFFDGIVSKCGGRILLIDTGISSAYGGALSALEISYTLTPNIASQLPDDPLIEYESGQTIRWSESEVVTAIQDGKPRRTLAKRQRKLKIKIP